MPKKPFPYKFGRLPVVKTSNVHDLAVYVAGGLRPPAAAVPVPDCDFPIDGNDQYGDCTIAGVAHLVAAWNAELRLAEPIPSADLVVSTYFQLTGGQDSGLAEINVLDTWRQQGLFGREILGFAKIAVQPTALKQGVDLFGGVYLGIQCPASAQQQFQAGEPWTYVRGSRIVGGHCVVAVGYDADWLYCATWGAVAKVAWSWLARYLQEAYVAIAPQYAAANTNLNLSLPQLEADMRLLSEELAA